MFSFTCTRCGCHDAGDFTEQVICKIDDKYKQGIYCPYNKTDSGYYYSNIKLRDGTIAVVQNDLPLMELFCDITPENIQVATEIYCNGTLETCHDDTDIRFHRYCRPSLQ